MHNIFRKIAFDLHYRSDENLGYERALGIDKLYQREPVEI